jgi:hypothetical protein
MNTRRPMSPRSHEICLRLCGIVAAIAGMVGGAVWLADLEERVQGDSLRWGLFANPLLQFPIFSYPFVETCCWILLACCSAEFIGGVLLLCKASIGRSFVVWQARVAIVINVVTTVYIVPMMFIFSGVPQWLWGTPTALMLRSGSVLLDLALWAIVGSAAAKQHFELQPVSTVGAFPVILKESHARAG